MDLITRLQHLEKAIPADELTPDEYRKVITAYKKNPIVKIAASGHAWYVTESITTLYHNKWDRWWHSLLPHRKDAEYNKKVEAAQTIFPMASYGFRTRGLLAFDNTTGPAIICGLLTFGGFKALSYLASVGDYESQQAGQFIDQFAVYAGLAGAGLGAISGSSFAYEQRDARKRTKKEAVNLMHIFSRINR